MKKGCNGTNGHTNGREPKMISAVLFLQSPNALYQFSPSPEEQGEISNTFDRITQSVQEQCQLLGIVADTSKSKVGEILVSGNALEIGKLQRYMRRQSWLLCSLTQQPASDTFAPGGIVKNSRRTNAR